MNMKKFLSILLVTSLVLGFSIIFLPKTTFSVVPPDPDEVWIDDDYNASTPGWGFNHFDTIQDGINAVTDGGTVHVVAGSYEESITINKSLSLVGETGAVIKAPATPQDAKIEESQFYFEYIVGVFGGTYNDNAGEDKWEGTGTVNVNISGFEIDGQNNGTGSSHRFVGIIYRNASGNISNCNIHDIYGPSGNGSGEETMGILVYGDSTVTIQDCTIKDFSRGGIGVSGDAGDRPDPVVEIKNNKIYGFKETDPSTYNKWRAENGIQIGYGAKGVVEGNEVYDCYVNSSYWASTGILVTDTSDVTVSSNYVKSNQQAIGVVDSPGIWGFPWNVLTVQNVDVLDNTLEDNDWGIEVSNGCQHINIIDNTILNTVYDAIDVWNYGYGDPSPTDVNINYNIIMGSGGDGLWTDDLQTDTVNAENNYWGANDGPSGEGPGSGDSVVGNVDYTPWLRRVEAVAGDTLIYFTPGGSPAKWRVMISSKGYDTGWMTFDRSHSSRGYMSGYYSDKRYKFILNYSSGRYHIIFYDRSEGISLKLTGRD